jgi:hypothetical protein
MSSTDILINTASEDNPHVDISTVDVVPDDADVVIVDTIRTDLDQLVKEAPSSKQKPRPAPVTAPPPTPVAPPPAKVAPQKRQPSPKKPAPSQPSPTKKMLDGQSAFEEALRGTIPTAAPSAEPDEPDEEVPPEDNGEVPDGQEADDESSSSSDDQQPQEDGDEEDEEEEQQHTKAKKEEVEEEEVDEDKLKMSLLEESAAYMSDGFLPAQQPTFAMSVETLKKIVEHQEKQASEAFGIGLLGYSWVKIISLIEVVNEKFDPAVKILGPGHSLRLNGATDAISKNIHRYRGSFRYIWRKMQSKKLEQYSPLITMGLVTVDILSKVHGDNVKKELRRQAQETMRTRPTPADLKRAQDLYGVQMPAQQPPVHTGRQTPSEAPAEPLGFQPSIIPGEQVPPPSAVAAAVAAQPLPEDPQPDIIPVDSIVIPESDNEQSKTAAAADDDDDDVVVKVPVSAGKGRGGKKK